MSPFHKLTNTAYLSDIAVRNIYESFTHKMAAKSSWYRYGTKLRSVTLCIATDVARSLVSMFVSSAVQKRPICSLGADRSSLKTTHAIRGEYE